MWGFFANLFVFAGELLWTLYNADDRRVARRFTLGCGVVLLTALGVIVTLATR